VSVWPKMPSTHAFNCGKWLLGQDVRQLGLGSDADKQHLAVLDQFMREVLPNVDVLGALPAPDDVVPPLDAQFCPRTPESEISG
jgi:hypothetical protein